MGKIMIILNKTQKEAVAKALSWYYFNSYNKPYFVMVGPAGSGKSFLVKYIVNELGLPPHYKVLYCAYTGKAALRLRIAGNNANTIHKTFYNIYKTASGTIRFSRKKRLDSNIKLIIIDEFSMINQQMINDILAFRVPTILIGDGNQIPPIFGKNKLIDDPREIDVKLTEVMRQNDTSGILDLAQIALDRKEFRLGTYKKCNVVSYYDIENIMHKYDVVLCWKNETRLELNEFIRKKLGFSGLYPKKGEKVLTLKNDYNHLLESDDLEITILNGMISYMQNDTIEDKDYIYCDFIPDFIANKNEEGFNNIKCHKSYFQRYTNPYIITPSHERNWKKKTQDMNESEEDSTVHLDFGYALSYWKAQGSEWQKVLVLDEYRGSEDHYFKLMYSSITRARESVDIALI